MKVTFLGTKANIEEQSKNHLKHSCILVEKDDTRLLIDYGRDWQHSSTITKLKPTHVLLTHAHPDHAGGLEDPKLQGLDVWMLPAVWETLSSNIKEVIDHKNLIRYQWNKLGSLDVKPIPVSHSIKFPTNGFVISDGKSTIGYFPDILSLRNYKLALKGINTYIGDGSYITDKPGRVRRDEETNKPYGHATIEEQVRWCNEVGIKHVIITHCGKELIEIANEELKRHLKQLEKQYNLTIEIATDNKVLRLGANTIIYAMNNEHEIADVFARAKLFLIVKGSTKEWIKNPYVEESPAAPKVIEMLLKYKPSKIVAGNFGPIAKELLGYLGIEIEYKTGKLAKYPPGIYLVEPHGKLIAKRKKLIIISTKPTPKQYLKTPLIFIDDKKAYGLLEITECKGPYNASLVRYKMRDLHQISDEEWKSWWPDAKQVYVYKFSIIKLFDEPVPVKVPQGIQKWIRNVEINLETYLVSPSTVKEVLKDPSLLKEWKDRQLYDDHRICHMWAGDNWKTLPHSLTKEEVKRFHNLIVEEIEQRKLPFEHTTPLMKSVEEILTEIEKESPYAPIAHYGEILGETITLREVLEAYEKPIVLKRPYISIVGGIANWGSTQGDIDRLWSDPKYIKEIHQPIIFRLGRAAPKFADRFQDHWVGEYGGPFTNYIPLYDLVLVPSKLRQLVRMQARVAEVREKEAAAQAKQSYKEDKLVPLRFFLALKGHRAYYRFADLIPSVVGQWFKPEDIKKGIVVQKKYDGIHSEWHKKGKVVKAFSEDGREFTHRVPTLVKWLQEHGPEEGIWLAEVESWKDGKHQPREVTGGYLHAKGPVDDSHIVPNVYDCVYFYDPKVKKHDLPGTVGDLHKMEYLTRLKYLELTPWSQSTNDVPKPGKFNMTPSILVKSPKELIDAIKEVAKAPASEGALVKLADSDYPLSGLTDAWLKWKKMADIHVVILEGIETKTPGVFNYRVGVRIPPGWKVPEKLVYKVGNKSYMYIGKTFNVKGKLLPGTVITLSFHTVNWYRNKRTNEQWLTVYEPKFIEVRKGQKTPDSVTDVIEIAHKVELLVKKEVMGSADIIEEAKFFASLTGYTLDEVLKLHEFTPSTTYLRIPMDDKPHKAVMQNHYRGKSCHMDFRIKVDDFLEGFTIAHQRAGVIKDDVTTVKQAKEIEKDWDRYFKMTNKPQTYIESLRRKLFVEKKKPEPVEWLDIEGVVEPGEVGATKYEYGVFSIVQKCTVYVGAQKPDFYEFFIEDTKFNGRWVIRLLPNPWKREMPRTEFVYLMWKPEDQLPYVLSRRAVKKGWIPPYGVSCLPPKIRSRIPTRFKYWEKKNTIERKRLRDALVDAIKRGEVKLSMAVYLGAKVPPTITSPIECKGVLQHHWWSAEKKPVRVGPTTEHWDLRIDWDPNKPLLHFILNDNPIYADEVSAIFDWCKDKSWMKKGLDGPTYLKPGTPGNPTKKTPAYIETLDTLKVKIYESSDTFLKMDIKGKRLKGHFVLVAKEPRMNLWTLKREEKAPKVGK